MYEYQAIVTAVHDGDTLSCDVDLGFRVWLKAVQFRLYGINAPELSTPAGPAARDALLGRLPLGSTATIKTLPSNQTDLAPDKKEKFGRWLGIISCGEPVLNVNDWMVKSGFAVPYFP